MIAAMLVPTAANRLGGRPFWRKKGASKLWVEQRQNKAFASFARVLEILGFLLSCRPRVEIGCSNPN